MTADRPATEPRTEAAAELTFYLHGALIAYPDDRTEAILTSAKEYMGRIEAEAAREVAQGAAPLAPDEDAAAVRRPRQRLSEGAAPRPHRHERDDHIGGYCLEGAAPRADEQRFTAGRTRGGADIGGAAPRAEGHTQDCINAFYSDGGQSGCICGADRCSWTIRCEGETDHSGPHHSKDRFAAPRAEGLDAIRAAIIEVASGDVIYGRDVERFADDVIARLSRPSDERDDEDR